MRDRTDVDDRYHQAVLAIAPEVLGLTPVGRARLIAEGTSYFSDAELDRLYKIVAAADAALRNCKS